MDPVNLENPERVVSTEQSRSIEPRVERDNHWITIASMALFVLMSLGVIVFLYYQNQQLKSMLASYQTQPSPTPVATADPTADWKTYSHKQLSFTIKYPPEWAIKEDPKFVEFDTNMPSDKKLMDSDKNVNYIFQVSIDPQTNFDEWTKYTSTTKLESQTVGGQVFERYIAADLYYSLNLILKYNGKNFRFMAYPYEASVFPKSLNDDIDQILSTFKVITATSSASPVPTQKACTLEAKVCPDGSSVGRTGPNCEFAPCPISK
jgi:hypothetical protein